LWYADLISLKKIYLTRLCGVMISVLVSKTNVWR